MKKQVRPSASTHPYGDTPGWLLDQADFICNQFFARPPWYMVLDAPLGINPLEWVNDECQRHSQIIKDNPDVFNEYKAENPGVDVTPLDMLVQIEQEWDADEEEGTVEYFCRMFNETFAVGDLDETNGEALHTYLSDCMPNLRRHAFTDFYYELYLKFVDSQATDCTWEEVQSSLDHFVFTSNCFFEILWSTVLGGMQSSRSAFAIKNEAKSVIRKHLQNACNHLRSLYDSEPPSHERLGSHNLFEIQAHTCFTNDEIQLPQIITSRIPLGLKSEERGGYEMTFEGHGPINLKSTSWVVGTIDHSNTINLSPGGWKSHIDRCRTGVKSALSLVEVMEILPSRSEANTKSAAFTNFFGLLVEGAHGVSDPMTQVDTKYTDSLRKTMQGRLLMASSLWASAHPWKPTPSTIVTCAAALECILGSGASEIGKTLAQRCSVLLEPNRDHRKEASAFIKDVYNIRSRIVHGDIHIVDHDDIVKFKSLLAAVMLASIVWCHTSDLNSKQMLDSLDEGLYAESTEVPKVPLVFARQLWHKERLDPADDFFRS